LSSDDRLTCLRDIESFLVRRMLCRLTTKDYNHLFLELLSRVQQAEPGSVTADCRSYLLEQTADARRWPEDRELLAALLDLPHYRLLTRARLRMVLEAIEDALRGPLAEQQHGPTGQQIEHIMPQSWPGAWPLDPTRNAVEQEVERDRLIHTIGNLTLVNPKLNVKLSNDSWPEKRRLVDANSVLYLNKALLADVGEAAWDDQRIRERSRQLTDIVATIWPR
jgi:hypothetical protein